MENCRVGNNSEKMLDTLIAWKQKDQETRENVRLIERRKGAKIERKKPNEMEAEIV